MRKTILALVAATLCAVLVGCGGKWTKPGATQADFDRDWAACDYEAAKYGYGPMWGTGVGAGIEDGLRQNELRTKCMRAKGWYIQNQ